MFSRGAKLDIDDHRVARDFQPGGRQLRFGNVGAFGDDVQVGVPRVAFSAPLDLDESDSARLGQGPELSAPQSCEGAVESGDLLTQGRVVDPEGERYEPNLSTLRQLSDTGSHSSTSFRSTGDAESVPALGTSHLEVLGVVDRLHNPSVVPASSKASNTSRLRVDPFKGSMDTGPPDSPPGVPESDFDIFGKLITRA